MLSNQLALKYAQAVYDLAAEKEQLETVGKQLAEIDKVIAEHEELNTLMYHPRVPAAAKKETLSKVFGNDIHEFIRNFLFLLIDRHREVIYPEIVKEFSRLYNEACNIIEAEVITAIPLADADFRALSAKLSTVTGKTVYLKTVVNQQILGGVIIKLGDKLIDGSVRRQLQALKDSLLSVEVTKIGVTDLV